MLTLLASIAAAALMGWVWVERIEPNWFHLRHKTVRVNKPLPGPLTVLHLSDLHFVKERFFVSRFFEKLERLEIDFVFVTGDLIDAPSGIEPCINHLKKLKPKQGTYVVLGNHDYRIYPPFEALIHLVTGKDFTVPRREGEIGRLKQAVEEAGFHLLLNRNIPISLGNGQKAYLIGTDDPITGRADFKRAFHGVENGVLHLALTHAPIAFPSLGRHGVDIAFAGHTHGGQLRFPLIGPIPLAYHVSPIIDSTDRYGFVGLVSRGMGAQPVGAQRLFCRPEAVLVRIEGS